jgi:dCTP deaminase
MLSDGELLELIGSGHIDIKPFSEKNLTPNGYDLSVGGIDIEDAVLKADIYEKFLIPRLSPFRVVSLEYVTLSNGFTANLWLKQRYARRNIQATFSQIDAEFFGTLAFCCFNANNSPITIEKGSPFAQIVFHRLDVPPLKGYAERSGHYKGQKDTLLK